MIDKINNKINKNNFSGYYFFFIFPKKNEQISGNFQNGYISRQGKRKGVHFLFETSIEKCRFFTKNDNFHFSKKYDYVKKSPFYWKRYSVKVHFFIGDGKVKF